MIPRDKALDLIREFKKDLDLETAKKYALITLNLILEHSRIIKTDEALIKHKNYFLEVKDRIEKL